MVVDEDKRADAFAREEASQKALRESIDLNKQLIAKSDALLKGRGKTAPSDPTDS